MNTSWRFVNFWCILILRICISLADDIAVNDASYEELNSPCAHWYFGDPDLHTIDLIHEYHLDQYDEVYEIQGSNNFQVAYHLEEESNLTIRTFSAFPRGFPEQFSFECTFRTQEPPQNPWYLFQLTDYSYQSQLSITMNPIYETVDFSLPQANGSIQTVSFQESSLFDSSWHKVMLGVTQDTVRLWVDCKQIDHFGTEHADLHSRGPVDQSGFFSVGQNTENKLTVPIDLQWMVMSCDADKPTRTTCEEIPKYDVLPHGPPDQEYGEPPRRTRPSTNYIQNQTRSCPEQCPRGPPGIPGVIEYVTVPGVQGLPGLRGPPGLQGYSGFNGTKGERGQMGLPGQPGQPGEIIQVGYSDNQDYSRVRGEKGERGYRGFDGLPGAPGAPGAPGIPGVSGEIGLTRPPLYPGSMATPGLPGEKGEPGNDGLPGIQGNPGNDGLPGMHGQQGLQGLPGLPGNAGLFSEHSSNSNSENSMYGEINESQIREICMAVVRDYIDETSLSLIGPPGPPGPPGLTRQGKIGRPGPQGLQGEIGQTGLRGQRGFHGFPGVPGSEGTPGKPGEPGEKGDRGEDGTGRDGMPGQPGEQGLQGYSGPIGPDGHRGDSGMTGQPGPRGPPGQPGICPDCNSNNNLAAYYSMLNYQQQQQQTKGPQNMKG